jgi:two-component system, chemotaxis family, CheB/CheR fusion protein
MVADPQMLEPNNDKHSEMDASRLGQNRHKAGKVAEQVQTDGVLRISEEWLRLTIEQIRDFAIITLDAAGTIVTWNEGAEIMFGYRADEAIGQSGALIFTPEDRARNAHIQEMETAQSNGRAADERYHLRKDGTRFYVSGVLTSLWGDGLIGYAKVARDLSERKQAEETLQQLNQTLESRVQERTEEVRNLVIQLTLSEQAERRRISEMLHDDLQQRLYSMNFQLTAARQALDQGNLEIARQTLVEVEEALNNAVQITRSLSVDLSPPILHQEGLLEAIRWLALQMKQQYKLSVTVEAEESMPLPDEDLRVLLFQTVREFLFNVVKHASAAAASVSLTHVDGQIRIQVRDGGHGFDLNAERGQESQGLLRVQQRVQLMGGDLKIESAPGQGTCITLSTPLHRAIQR